MEKVVRDGKVAVLYSPGFGAGWYTWNTEHKGLIFDPEIVEAVLSSKPAEEIIAIAQRKYPKGYFGGASDLKVEWLDEGTVFGIDEYDGNERVHVAGAHEHLVA